MPKPKQTRPRTGEAVSAKPESKTNSPARAKGNEQERRILREKAICEYVGKLQHGEADDTYTGRKERTFTREKAAIAHYIVEQLPELGSTLFFDAGSTLRMIARATFMRAKEKHLNLIITTNNMDISEDFLSRDKPYSQDPLSGAVSLQLTGGKYDPQHRALFGRLAAGTLDNIYPEIVIIGLTGFTFEEGLFFHGATEEDVVKAALYSKETNYRILAFDHSKFGSRDLYPCVPALTRMKEGLCISNGVKEKTLIVTSEPPDEGSWIPPDDMSEDDRQKARQQIRKKRQEFNEAWRQLRELAEKESGDNPKAENHKKGLGDAINEGELEVIAVALDLADAGSAGGSGEDPLHARVVRKICAQQNASM